MIRKFESVGKTVDEAIQSGLSKMRLTLDCVSIDILDEGTKGFLGIFGGKLARVMITELENNDDANDISTLFKSSDFDTSATSDSKKFESDNKPILTSLTNEQQVGDRIKTNREFPDIPITLPNAEVDDISKTAIEFLSELTQLMGIKAEVTALVNAEHLAVNITGENMGVLIGHRGETLDALQYLTSLYINRQKDNYVRVFLDIEQYRERREESIVRLAEKMAARAIKIGRRIAMEPMNAYERRIFHSALQKNDKVTTHSEGEEPNRRITIIPKDCQPVQKRISSTKPHYSSSVSSKKYSQINNKESDQ